jgi:hypothetical protein
MFFCYFLFQNIRNYFINILICIQALLKNYKDKIGITEIEEGLNKYNSKTCDIEKFKEYINTKIKTNEKLVPLYQQLKFR